MMNCLVCDRIKLITKNRNPYFVRELSTGYVVLGDSQYFNGYTLFLSKEHVVELHMHSNPDAYLKEMRQVGEAVFKAFNPIKLNYEILGNSDPHLHTHIFPRYKSDLYPNKPIWIVDKKIRDSVKPTPDELAKKIKVLDQYLTDVISQ